MSLLLEDGPGNLLEPADWPLRAMAFRSPSPQLSPTLVGGGSNLAVKSERRNTPSPTHAPLNKRDRRRNALADRLMDLSTHFSQNRDGYFRQQLQMLQTDMNLIMRADPYQDQPLDDYGDDVADLVGSSLSGTVPNSTSAVTSTTTNGVNGPVALQRRMESDEAAMSGRVYASFVEEVNHCMEERDAALTQLAVSPAPRSSRRRASLTRRRRRTSMSVSCRTSD